MPIEHVGTTTTVSSAAGTSAVVNLPVVPANTRLMVGLALNTSGTITTPSGWALSRTHVDGNCRLGVYYNYQSTTPSSVTFTITSADWAAIAVGYTGAHMHGFATVGNISDSPANTIGGESGTDTEITTGAFEQGYTGQGICRLSFHAVTSATLGGWTSITPTTGTMVEVADVVSSGATPVQLALAHDSGDAPRGNWGTSGTSVASASDKVVVNITLRPDVPPFHYATQSAVSSSAGTAVDFTITGGNIVGRSLFILDMAANSTATFSVPAPWQQVHGTTTGNMRHETWIRFWREGDNTTVNATLSASSDWAVSVAYYLGTWNSDNPSDVFAGTQVDTDVVSDTAITSTSISAGAGELLHYGAAASGISQAISAQSDTWATTDFVGIANVTSSGSPRVVVRHAILRSPVSDGDTGTVTTTWAVATTEKTVFTGRIKAAVTAYEEARAITQTAGMRASRW